MIDSSHDTTDPHLLPTNQWTLAKNIDGEGNPILVMFNSALKAIAGRTSYTIRIGFAVPLKTTDPSGIPNPDEIDQVNGIAKHIEKRLSAQGSAIKALAITAGTFKEFVFYAQPGLDVQAVHEQLMDEIESHEVHCYARMDENWDAFREWSEYQ